MASTYAPELVNTVLRGLRQQRLDDGWISELELQFAGPSPSEQVFDFKDESATQWADEFDDHTGAQLPGDLVHAGIMEEIPWVKEIGQENQWSRSKAQRHHSCAHQVGCDRQGRLKQTESEMQTCGQRVALEDERNLACARTLQCNATVGDLYSVVGTVSDDVPSGRRRGRASNGYLRHQQSSFHGAHGS